MNNFIEISDVPRMHSIFKVSNPHKLKKRANELGFSEPIYLSTRIDKNIYDPKNFDW